MAKKTRCLDHFGADQRQSWTNQGQEPQGNENGQEFGKTAERSGIAVEQLTAAAITEASRKQIEGTPARTGNQGASLRDPQVPLVRLLGRG